MKKIKIASLGLLALLPMSCVDFDDATQPITVTVQVLSPQDLPNADLQGHTVSLTGTNGYTATTDASGNAVFSNIVPDVYSVSTSWKLTAAEYAQATGKVVENRSFTISGSLPAKVMSSSSDAPIQMSVNITQDQSILIGKVYYQGNKDNNNKNYTYAKYLELYNNSDEAIDVAGLYIALMESSSPNPAYAITYFPQRDSIVAKQVFRIPASPSCMVKPGGTVLIVNSAVDHSTKGASEEPNLLDADFEAKDLNSSKPHENNPAVRELPLVYGFTTQTYLNLMQGGPSAVAIFSTTEDVATDWVADNLTYAYGKKSGSKYMKIPTHAVIDAVDILKYNGETGVDVNTKRFYDYLDAGYTYTEVKNGYDGRLVVRKTASVTADGRKILQDTNNSSNDFESTDELNPREYK